MSFLLSTLAAEQRMLIHATSSKMRLQRKLTNNRQATMCTLEKRGKVFILTLTGEDEHRLNPNRIELIRSALVRIRSDPAAASSSALVITAQGKFFSNGFDLAWAQRCPARIRLMSAALRSLTSDLISLPMPTVAAVTGHASAAGFILALSNDYIVMRKDRGFLYMSEMDIGLKIPKYFMSLIGCKIGDPKTRRQVIMKAAKLTAKEAFERGIADAACDNAEETVVAAVGLAKELADKGWVGEVYAGNRRTLLKDVLDELGVEETTEDVNSVVSKI